MRSLIRIFGVLLAILGLPSLFLSAILLNQQFRLVRVTWGIFDMRVNDVSVSMNSAIAVSGVVGVALVVGGFVLARRPRRVAG